MDTSFFLQSLLVFLFLFLSAFFSGSETAFFSLTKAKMRQVENPRVHQLISSLLKTPRRLITTIIIGNELVNVASTALATSLLISLIGDEAGVSIAIILMSLLLLIFGEITPKTFAVYNPVRFAKTAAFPMNLFRRAIFPLEKAIESLVNFIFPQPTMEEPKVTEEEFKTLIQVSQEEGILDKKEKKLIENIMGFTDTTVREIMVGREGIFALPIYFSLSKSTSEIKHNFHSRIPVYKESIDNIQGILFTKDLLISSRKKRPYPSLAQLVKPAYFISQDTLVVDLLREFQARKVHLAVVIDPQGKTVGLVSLDDLLEEIFGELEEKEEASERLFEPLSGNTYRVSGKMNIDDFNQTLASHIDAEDYETMGGFLLGLFGENIKKGARRKCHNLEFRIRKIRKNQIKEFTVRKLRSTAAKKQNKPKDKRK